MNKSRISMKQIMNMVANHYMITPSQMMKSSRCPSLVLPRQISMYLTRKYTNMSYPQIAMRMGMDHKNIMYGHRKILAAIARGNNAMVAKAVSKLESKLNGEHHD